MNNGTYRKNSLNKKIKKNETTANEDDIVIKRRSPYLYNRTNLPNSNNVEKRGNHLPSRVRKEIEPLIIGEPLVEETKTEETDMLNKKIVALEKQLATLKWKVDEQDNIILRKNIEIRRINDEKKKLKDENERLKRRHIEARQVASTPHYMDEGILMLTLDPLSTPYDLMGFISNLREMMAQQPAVEDEEEEKLINELYPNPDTMTYEELLELENRMGFVTKGLTQEQINVNIFMTNLENPIS
jgi:hypothetical protein